MVSECGRSLAPGRALFVVFVVCTVTVPPLPLVLRSGGVGYESRRFGRRVHIGTALFPVIPTYSRGSGDIVVIHCFDYSKA